MGLVEGGVLQWKLFEYSFFFLSLICLAAFSFLSRPKVEQTEKAEQTSISFANKKKNEKVFVIGFMSFSVTSVRLTCWLLKPYSTSPFFSGEICAFKIYGQDAPFEAVVLNRTSGEGVLKASSPVDCESQKEYTFIIQAYDCGAGPSGADWKKSHK